MLGGLRAGAKGDATSVVGLCRYQIGVTIASPKDFQSHTFRLQGGAMVARKNRIGSLAVALILSLGAEMGFAQSQDINAALTAIRNDAAKVSSSTGAARETAKQALLKEVGNAIAKAKNSEEVSAILAAALTAAPAEVVAITRVAVAAAPARAVEITVIALNGVTDQGQRVAIVNTSVATFNASRRDAETSATLQSLLTQTQTTQTKVSQSQSSSNETSANNANKSSDSPNPTSRSDVPAHEAPVPPGPVVNASPS